MTDTRENFVDRLLGLGSDPLPGRDPGVRLQALTAVLLVHACVETWSWVFELQSIVAGVVLLAIGFTASAGLWLVRGWRRTALLLAAAVTAIQIGATFPYVANHTFLRLIVMLLLAVPNPQALRESRLVHAAIGWTTAIVLFYTGFQKILYGTYFHGQYLAYMISFTDRFKSAFAWLVPQAELTRLRAIEAPVPGSGPFTVDAPVFLILSNLVYVAEIALAVGLLWPRTRRMAIWLTIGMLFVIELSAREVFFGLMFTHLLLALHPEDLNRRLLPLSLAVYALALLAKITGWEGFFT